MDNYYYINKPKRCDRSHNKKDLIELSLEYCINGNGKYLCDKCKEIFIIPHKWPKHVNANPGPQMGYNQNFLNKYQYN